MALVSLSGPRHTLPSRSMVESGEPATSQEPVPKAVLGRICCTASAYATSRRDPVGQQWEVWTLGATSLWLPAANEPAGLVHAARSVPHTPNPDRPAPTQPGDQPAKPRGLAARPTKVSPRRGTGPQHLAERINADLLGNLQRRNRCSAALSGIASDASFTRGGRNGQC
jgi:hypothetical protein